MIKFSLGILKKAHLYTWEGLWQNAFYTVTVSRTGVASVTPRGVGKAYPEVLRTIGLVVYLPSSSGYMIVCTPKVIPIAIVHGYILVLQGYQKHVNQSKVGHDGDDE